MIDAKEKEGISKWVRDHCHLLFRNQRNKTISRKQLPKVQSGGPLTIQTSTGESDDGDDDFSASVSDLDGSERLSEENSSEDEDNGNGDGNEDGDEDAKIPEDENHHLDPARHSLLRQEIRPRMTLQPLDWQLV